MFSALWQKKSTGSATLKKFSLFAFGFSLFAFETGCLFFAFRFWISAFRFSISDYVTVVFFSILVFDFRLFNFKKNSELSSQFLISIIQFVTFYKYLFTWVYSVSFAKITHPRFWTLLVILNGRDPIKIFLQGPPLFENLLWAKTILRKIHSTLLLSNKIGMWSQFGYCCLSTCCWLKE